MKIEKQVDVTVDVDVEIDLDDIVACIAESTDTQQTCKRGISNAHRFLKAIPDRIIASMMPAARETIYKALLEQAERYAAVLQSESETESNTNTTQDK